MLGIPAGLSGWAQGWLSGFGIILPFYMMRGMAAGDVKLMAAVGAWLGAGMALKIALATFVIGGAWAMVLIVTSGQSRATLLRVGHMLLAAVLPGSLPVQPDAEASAGTMPYGVAIAAGTVAMLFAGS
ncbi:hypothetical protein D9M69_489300 [compost metagenome]